MKLNQIIVGGVEVTLSEKELSLLCNALNVACNGLSIGDFHPRMGATLHQANAAHDELLEILASLRAAKKSGPK